MIVLIDLDDTLLTNDMSRFQGFYLKLLADALGALVPASDVVPQVLDATRKMVTKTAVAGTLEEVFDRAFYPALNTTRAALQPAIDRFYTEVFPTLQTLTSPRPDMAALVQQMFARGWKVAVATKPLFPRTAVVQRLGWAGLTAETGRFSQISTYEFFHFSKPNPAFFAEMLYQLGWPEEPAVMIGNDLEDDILPAVTLGLPAFLLLAQDAHAPAPLPSLAAAGRADQIWPWLLQRSAEKPPELPASPASLLARLRAFPAAADTLIRKTASPDLKFRPSAADWSLTEILCHIRDVDLEVNIPRFQKILTQDSPFLPGIETDGWVKDRGCQNEDGHAALQGMIHARQTLLETLEPLPAQEWYRPARHAIFGPTLLAELAGFITLHDRTHIQQIAALLQPR